MKFNLPFFSDDKYVEFLNIFQDDIESVYFELKSGYITSAREPLRLDKSNFEKHLTLIPQKKYIVLNGRYNSVVRYSSNQIKIVVDELKSFYDQGILDGILFLDFYLLRLLFDTDKDFFNQIDVVPSINCLIDSKEKLISYFNYLHLLGYNKIPNKIILDRSLNRNFNKLKEISNYIRNNYPESKIEILVNESCLYNCPFKQNHDIFVSLMSDPTVQGVGYINSIQAVSDFELDNLNIKYGCLNLFKKNKYLALTTPFIRPEDLKYVKDYVDVIKISGRTLGPDFIEKTFRAYKNEKYDENLIELMDSLNALKSKIIIDNSKIPQDFFEVTSNCNKDCINCNYCKRIINEEGL